MKGLPILQVRVTCSAILDVHRAEIKLAFRHYVGHAADKSQRTEFTLSPNQLRAMAKDIKCSAECFKQLAAMSAVCKREGVGQEPVASTHSPNLSLSEFVEVLVRIAFVQFKTKPSWALDRRLQAFFEAHFAPFAIRFAVDNFRALLSDADVQPVIQTHMVQLERLYCNMCDPQEGCLTIGSFVDLFRQAELVNEVLSISRLTSIFLCSNFDDLELNDWRDWDFRMELTEFAEAMARVSVVHNLQPPIDKLVFSEVTKPELCYQFASFFSAGSKLLAKAQLRPEVNPLAIRI